MSLVDDLVSLRASLPLPPVHHHPAVSASTPRAAPTADGTTHRAPPTVSARDDFTAVAALQCEVGDALDDLIAESAAVYVAGVRPRLVASSSVGCAAAPAHGKVRLPRATALACLCAGQRRAVRTRRRR